MLKNWTYASYLNGALSLMVLISVIFPRLFGLSVLAYIVVLIIGFRKKQLEFRLSPMSVLFALLYLIYAVGLIAGTSGAFDPTYLEYKLSFLAIPVLFAFQMKQESLSLARVGGALIFGVSIQMLYGLGNSLFCYANGGGIACFLTTNISPVHHPSYLVAILITAMFVAWLGWFQKWKFYRLQWIIPFTLAGLLYHVFCLSLAGILYLMLALVVTAMYGVYRRLGWKFLLLSCLVFPFLAYLFITRVPQVEGEWNGAKWYADEYLKDPEAFVRNAPYPASGSEIRLIVWTVSWEVFKAHPMGVGTGNLDEAMSERLEEYGQHELAEKKLNPHNQFLQTGVEIGWLGLSVLMAILFYAFWHAVRYRNGLLLLVVSCLAFNCLFESMLQRQSGIVFFTFWICLLMIIDEGQRRTESRSIPS